MTGDSTKMAQAKEGNVAELEPIDLTRLEPLLDDAAKPGSLIPILQKTQDLYGYLPADALVAPGPRVTKQMPGRPVALPWASAMIAAPLSCRHTVTAISRSWNASSAAM